MPGSTHGYDVADPTRINPELGGEDGFERLAARLAEHGMGVLLDIVPNHMAASSHNPFWMEMLERGPDCPAAKLFDVFWEKGRLLLPVLGDPLQATLEAGQLSLRAEASGRIVLAYADHAFPLRPESVAELRAAAGLSEAQAPLSAGDRAKLDAVLAAADLAAILDAQHWRLAWWRTAAHDLNYRRFFNITDLVGVRVEDPEVFEIVHRLPLDLVRRGLVHGLRIDHIDGLVDPAGYCARLRALVGPDVPLVVEKILEPGERLRDWPIDGTTGYERLNDINGLFVDAEGYRALEEDLRARHLLTDTPAKRLADAKRQVLATSLAAEVETLTRLARDGLDADIAAGDLTEAAIRQAVTALIVHCPVYRSYATWDGHTPDDEAIWGMIRTAMEVAEDPLTNAAGAVLLERLKRAAHRQRPAVPPALPAIERPGHGQGFRGHGTLPHAGAALRQRGWRQPGASPRDLDEMHALNAARAAAQARDLTPLATHDTKRGPDTRARLATLSFRPDSWLNFLDETREACATLTRQEAGLVLPDPLDQVMILQTLVSAWPISEERIAAYLTKALREAKRHTNWETPDEAYEQAAQAFATAIVAAPEGEPIRTAIGRLVEALAPAARIVGLAQTVLQLTLPGTPDIYQGTEFRDFSLVDPDNRRPVDWDARRAALEGGGDITPEDREKFDLIRCLLALRRTNPALAHGAYTPLRLAPSPWRWFGFERRMGDDAVRVVVPTRVPDPGSIPQLSFPDGWGEEEWRDLAGAPIPSPGGPLPEQWPFLVAVTGDVSPDLSA